MVLYIYTRLSRANLAPDDRFPSPYLVDNNSATAQQVQSSYHLDNEQ